MMAIRHDMFTLPAKQDIFRCPGCATSWHRSISGDTAVSISPGSFRTKYPDAEGWLHCCDRKFQWEK